MIVFRLIIVDQIHNIIFQNLVNPNIVLFMQFPQGAHFLALDYGQKFTGVATYKLGSDPFPICWDKIPSSNEESLIAGINQIIQDEFVDYIVLGVPYFTDGKETKMSKVVKAFGQRLQQKAGIPLFEQDESLTTYEAEERMKNDPRFNFKVDYNKIDSLSASIILEEFLNKNS